MICPPNAVSEYVLLEPASAVPKTLADVPFASNWIGIMPSAGSAGDTGLGGIGVRDAGLLTGVGDTVVNTSNGVGVERTSLVIVAVEFGARIASVDGGVGVPNTCTWKVHAVVNNRSRGSNFVFMYPH